MTFKAPRIFITLALLLQLIAWIIAQVQSTGAVPGDEFRAAGILYGLLDILLWAGLLLLSLAMILTWVEARGALRRGHRRPAILTMLGALLMMAGLHWPVLLGLASVLLWRVDEESSRHALSRLPAAVKQAAEDCVQALRGVRWGDIGRWWLELGTLAGMASLAISLIESFTYTASFADWLFPRSTLLGYRLRLVDLSITFGATVSLLYVTPMILDRLLRRRDETSWRTLARARGLMAFIAVAFVAAGLFAVLGDEILKTGVLGATVALHLVLFSVLSRVMWRNLVTLQFLSFPKETPRKDTVWGTLALSILSIPLVWLPRVLKERLRFRPAILFLYFFAAATLWEVSLVYLAYPELEDFRSRLILMIVISAVNVAVLALFALASSVTFLRRRRPGRRRGFVFALLIAFGVAGSFRPLKGDEALVINEYSRFGFMIRKSSIRELIRPKDPAGSFPAKVTFEAHGEGEDRYPERSPLPASASTPPIVMVLWDAARPDHMGAYGYPRPTTPNMDRFAREAVVFERAYSGATATTCGVRHLFTGHYSSRYMLSTRHHPFFVHRLRDFGYRRFLITATGTDYNGVSIESFKRQGPAPEVDGSEFRYLARHPKVKGRERPDSAKAEEVMKAWRELIRKEGPRALHGSLTFLHLTGTHFPWSKANQVIDFGSSPVDLYDGEMAKLDRLTSRVFDVLKELGVWDDAVVMLVADHGTGLMEHGRLAGFLPYEEQIRVPLIMKIPGVLPRRVKAPVATIDVPPTLVGMLDPGGANTFDGISLLPLAQGLQQTTRRRWIHSLCAFEDAWVLIENGRYKLHYHRRDNYALLFDLQEDPAELNNLFNSEVEVRDRLVEMMRAFLWKGRHDFGNPFHYRAMD